MLLQVIGYSDIDKTLLVDNGNKTYSIKTITPFPLSGFVDRYFTSDDGEVLLLENEVKVRPIADEPKIDDEVILLTSGIHSQHKRGNYGKIVSDSGYGFYLLDIGQEFELISAKYSRYSFNRDFLLLKQDAVKESATTKTMGSVTITTQSDYDRMIAENQLAVDFSKVCSISELQCMIALLYDRIGLTFNKDQEGLEGIKRLLKPYDGPIIGYDPGHPDGDVTVFGEGVEEIIKQTNEMLRKPKAGDKIVAKKDCGIFYKKGDIGVLVIAKGNSWDADFNNQGNRYVHERGIWSIAGLGHEEGFEFYDEAYITVPRHWSKNDHDKYFARLRVMYDEMDLRPSEAIPSALAYTFDVGDK